MFKSIWQDLENQFRMGNMVMRLILVNFAVFLSLVLIRLALSIVVDQNFGHATYNTYLAPFIELSTSWTTTLTRPWVLISHMFMHYGLFHFIFNMLILYWFGRIVGDLIGNHRVLPIYILSGLASAVLLMTVNLFNTGFTIGQSAIGASGAVLGIVMASATVSPDYSIRLLFLGFVKLKFIALAVFVLQIISLGSNSNSGGVFGHLGGLFMGYYFISQLRNGKDYSIPINKLFIKIKQLLNPKNNKIPNSQVKVKTKFKSYNKQKNNSKATDPHIEIEKQVDQILEKIKTSGIESLSIEEKEILLKASNNKSNG